MHRKGLKTITATAPLSIYVPLVTQDGLRDEAQLQEMIEFVQTGGFFTFNAICRENIGRCDDKLILIAQFPDGQFFLWDGHHRVFAIFLGQRDYLDPSEYEILPLTYEQVMTPNFETGFVTPYDPRTEVRLKDFGPFKTYMLQLADHSEEKQLKKIRKKKHLYVKPRDVYTIKDFLGKSKL